MGMGLPLAIGFAAGQAEMALNKGSAPAPTAYITGDVYLAELDTIRRSGLFIIAVVSNDSTWGTVSSHRVVFSERHANYDFAYRNITAKIWFGGALQTLSWAEPTMQQSRVHLGVLVRLSRLGTRWCQPLKQR